jgi:hypothetical protein
MALTFKESRAVDELADAFYPLLPWSGSGTWKGHVNFNTVARRHGLDRFCGQGSKRPMIAQLLTLTLEQRRDRFERLMLDVVREGMTYRAKNGDPFRLDELNRINGAILGLGFKFPDLWDEDLRASLGERTGEGARRRAEQVRADDEMRGSVTVKRAAQIAALERELCALQGWTDRRAAGLELEKFLNALFTLSGLSPRSPFRVTGEQIDGSFELDFETYLLEAKWEKEALEAKALYEFRAVIEGKSAFTRGVFIAMNGITEEARQAITRGKQPTFFVVTGHDLFMVLSGAIGLKEFLRQRCRLLAEEGLVVVPFGELFSGSRAHGAHA